MILHPNKYINFMLRLLFFAIIGLLLYVGFKYVLKLIIPLILAYLISCIIIRPVNFLARKTKIPRQIWSIVFTLLTVTLMGLLLYGLFATLFYEAAQLVNSLPNLIDSAIIKLDDIQKSLSDLFVHLPGYLKDTPFFSLETWLQSIELPKLNMTGIFSSAASAASFVPTLLISTVFVFVSTYFLTSEREAITVFCRRQIGGVLYDTIAELKNFFYTSVFKWIKAQLILICVSFCVLSLWFLLLKQPGALPLAFFIAFIDALPILGVGTVMIPWALVDLLTGNYSHALLTLVVYVSVVVVRNTIEPKIMGVQLGMHPFALLLCIYFGFRMAGFAGMFFLPLAVLCLQELHKTGRIKLWK